jgi:selenocysteine-specific elongation factor
VNLQGLDRGAAPRGATIAHPGTLRSTRRAWAVVRLLASAPPALERGGRVRFHEATFERAARMRVLGRAADGIDEETLVAPGDLFILRRPAPVNTVGGGVIVESEPPRRAQEHDIDLAHIEPVLALRLRLARAGAAGRRPSDLAIELGLARPALERSLASLEAEGVVVRAGGSWFDALSWSELRRHALDELARFHDRETLRSGMSREALRVRAGGALSHDAWRDLLASLEAEGVLRIDGERVALAGHSVVLGDAERALADRIEATFRARALDPPDLAELVAPEDAARSREVIALLVESRKLVRIPDGRLFHADALADLRERLRRHAASSRTIDVAAFKALSGTSRKNAIPLLEHLDSERSTRRVGNVREILL